MLQDNEDLLLTPFEKNLEVWRQLWRVIERRCGGLGNCVHGIGALALYLFLPVILSLRRAVLCHALFGLALLSDFAALGITIRFLVTRSGKIS